MDALEPGTPVIVTIKGTATPERRDKLAGEYLAIETGGHSFDLWPDLDPAVQVVPIDPDRPTLDRETIARIVGRLRERAQAIEDHEGDALGDDTYAFDEWVLLTDAAKAIQAAHPEWEL